MLCYCDKLLKLTERREKEREKLNKINKQQQREVDREREGRRGGRVRVKSVATSAGWLEMLAALTPHFTQQRAELHGALHSPSPTPLSLSLSLLLLMAVMARGFE